MQTTNMMSFVTFGLLFAGSISGACADLTSSRKILAAVPAYGSPPVYPGYGGCQSIWASCGGLNHDGPTCCEEGSKCVVQNEFFSQCVPLVPSGSPSVPTGVNGCSLAYNACGGDGYEGPECCEPGSTCEVMNEFFSMCKPNPAPPGEAPSGSDGCALLFGQCGGSAEWKGPTCCSKGTKCVETSTDYSQCLLDAPSPPPSPPAVADGCATEYARCGGAGHTGPTCCPKDFECIKSDEFYSGCMPKEVPQSPPPPPGPVDAKGCVAEFSQCDGLLFGKAKCCAKGTKCVKSSIWFSQCLRPETKRAVHIDVPKVDDKGCSLEWQRCGGILEDGTEFKASDCCTEGTTCVKQNEFWSMCMIPTPPSPPSPPPAPLDANGCIGRYGQCGGGPDYAGPTCCSGANECVVANEYFSQCMARPLANDTAAWWQTCGSYGAWTGPTKCESLSTCTKMAEGVNAYWLCIPDHI